MSKNMPTVSDYSSFVELGVGVNLAASYLTMFVNPALARAEREISSFRWWVEDPSRLKAFGDRNLDPADFEDALSDWLYHHERMRKRVEKCRRAPVALSIISALLLLAVLLFPLLNVGGFEVAVLVLLALEPVSGGAIYLWVKTTKERKSERKAAMAAKALFATDVADR